MKTKNISAILISSSIILASFWVVLNQQDIIDWWRLRGYVAPPTIAALSDGASMNDEGERLFYVHYPELLDKQGFAGKCSDNEKTNILGCYISHDKIYIYDVKDQRLSGAKEVTAAHEMLHAAYDRLSNSDKKDLDVLLLKTFNDLNDDKLNKIIDSYRGREGSSVENELHSFLGSEYRNLPGALEEYYKNYFIDRSIVVTKAETYEAEFSNRETQIAELDSKILVLSSDIDAGKNTLSNLESYFVSYEAKINSLRSNPREYNEFVPIYNTRVRELRYKVSTLNDQIDQYNTLINQRNDIALEEQDLIKAIDSRITER